MALNLVLMIIRLSCLFTLSHLCVHGCRNVALARVILLVLNLYIMVLLLIWLAILRFAMVSLLIRC